MEEKSLKRMFITQFVIWVALVISVIIYFVMAKFVIGQEPLKGGPRDVTVIRMALAGVSVAIFGVITVIRKLFASGRLNLGGGAVSVGAYLSHNIVTWALSESVAIYGLLLFFMARNEYDLYGFMGLSLAYYMIFMPRYGAFKSWAANVGLVELEPSKSYEGRGYRR